MSVIPVIWPDGNLLDRIVAAIVTRVGRITGRSGEAPISIAHADFLAADTRPALSCRDVTHLFSSSTGAQPLPATSGRSLPMRQTGSVLC